MKKLRRSSLSDDAYTFVRSLFLNENRYSPGEKISVEELSRELGVSRTPLWGAIYRLEAEGIVEIVPRLGVYLIDYDPQKAVEIYMVREVLEGMAARLASAKITDAEIADLETNIAAQRERLKKHQLDKYYSLAIEFHEMVVRIAGSKTLERLLQSVFAQIRAMRLQRNYTPMHLPQSCDDHVKIMNALSAHDPEMAEKQMRRHIHDLTEQIARLDNERPRPLLRGKRALVT
jgi:DNA-binding GntR family transcriptional regulator